MPAGSTVPESTIAARSPGVKRPVTNQDLAFGETDRTIGFHAPHHDAFRVERLQVPERPYPAVQPLLRSGEEDGLAAGRLDLGQRAIAGSFGCFDPLDVAQVGRSDSVEQVAPALGLLRRLDRLDEGEAGAELPEGAYPVGAVEDEVAVLVRGDYYGVALLAFGFMRSRRRVSRSSSWASCRIRHSKVHQTQVSEGGDHAAEGGRPLEVSPTPAPEKVEQDEPAEEEQRDDEEEPYDAHKQVECVQSSPFKRCRRAVRPQTVGTAGFEPATTRPPAECATRLRHVPTRL